MNKISLPLFSISLVLVALVVGSKSFAAASGFIASGDITLDKTLTAKAQGIRTLFISVYNPESKMPMPLGASKISLEKDAKGKFTHFNLDQSSMMMMGGGEIPSKVNIKAKLDKDGNAGPDTTGDLIGWAKGVKVGDKHVKIRIDSAVP